MDDDRFENFLRTLTASPSRRSMLRTLGALTLGGGVAASFAEAEARRCGECTSLWQREAMRRPERRPR
jgi:hypothetical protein